MKKSFAVIGLGRFGLSIVKTLSELKCDVLAIDQDNERVSKASEYIQNCAVCDATKKVYLHDLAVQNVDHAIVAIGNNLQATILATINLHELGVKKITVRVDDEEYISVVNRLGATDIIIPEESAAVSLAHQIVSDNILDYYKIKKEYGVSQLRVKKGFNPIVLIDLDSRNKFDVNIVGIIRKEDFFIPRGTDKVIGEDILLVVGKATKVLKLDQYLNE